MSENNGWKPMTAERIAQVGAMPTKEFFVGANNVPAVSEGAAERSLQAARKLEPADVKAYLETILNDDGSNYSPFSFPEKAELKREISLLARMHKQALPDAFKRIAGILGGLSRRVNDQAKHDQVIHYLKNFSQEK